MSRVHVMVGLVFDAAGRVLVARRPDHVHQGGRWEFPGGKLEPGEAPLDGLRRELREELALEVLDAASWQRITHDYPDRQVLLDVWRVTLWRGEVRGLQQQPLRWLAPADLVAGDFPAANVAIVTGLQSGM